MSSKSVSKKPKNHINSESKNKSFTFIGRISNSMLESESHTFIFLFASKSTSE
jgi:hypothetical protein